MTTNGDLKVGDRVLLLLNSLHSKYQRPTLNPVNVLGTVISMHLDNSTPAWRVDWDNGEWNYYLICDNDLILQQIGDPDSHTLNTMRW